MTDSNNPYAPPRAAVADVFSADGEFQPVKIFSASGRIGRLRYMAYLTAGYVIYLAVAAIIGGLAGAVVGNADEAIIVGSVVALIFVVPYLIFSIMVCIQRCHDMNWSGWAALLALIPLAGLIWVFMPGTQGANRFGLPPVPNSTSVKVLAVLFPVMVVVGIVANVVNFTR